MSGVPTLAVLPMEAFFTFFGVVAAHVTQSLALLEVLVCSGLVSFFISGPLSAWCALEKSCRTETCLVAHGIDIVVYDMSTEHPAGYPVRCYTPAFDARRQG